MLSGQGWGGQRRDCSAASGSSALGTLGPGGGLGAGGVAQGKGVWSGPFGALSRHLITEKKYTPQPSGTVSATWAGLSVHSAQSRVCLPPPSSPPLHQGHQHPTQRPWDSLSLNLPLSHVWCPSVRSLCPSLNSARPLNVTWPRISHRCETARHRGSVHPQALPPRPSHAWSDPSLCTQPPRV